MAGGGKTPSATEDEVSDFARTGAGRMLVPEWRGRAAQKLGKVFFKLDLMLDNMPPDAADKAERWYRNLPPTQKAAVIRMLAG